MTWWIRPADAAYEVLRQADATARALGHDMQPWAQRGELEQSKCNACGDVAIVAPRSFARSPLSGAALSLRCRPRPAYVRGARVC
jgi:hypothetical protein